MRFWRRGLGRKRRALVQRYAWALLPTVDVTWHAEYWPLPEQRPAA